jgi:hypothetical protein
MASTLVSMTPAQLERYWRGLPLDEPEGEAAEEEAARVAQQLYDPEYSESEDESDDESDEEAVRVAERWEAKNEFDMEEELYISLLTPDERIAYTREDDFMF